MIGANDLTAAYVQCGTWDTSSYNNAAATIAQQCIPAHHSTLMSLVHLAP